VGLRTALRGMQNVKWVKLTRHIIKHRVLVNVEVNLPIL
jgi:hypothetical protein